MIRAVALCFVFCCMASTAPAQQRCNQPYAPQIPNGRTASEDEMISARRDTTAFIAASDLYQRCLGRDMRSQELVAANQREKERIGDAFNTALAAFRGTHRDTVELSSR